MTAGGRLGKWLPGTALLLRYERSQFRHDALAALVFALVTIPSAFAYADLARCTPAAGLYAAVAGMVGARVVHELASRIRTLTFLRTKVPLPARAVEPIQFEQQETESRDWEDDVEPVCPAEEQ